MEKWEALIPTAEFMQENKCLDICQGVIPAFGDTIFRSRDELRTLSKDQVHLYLTNTWNSSLAEGLKSQQRAENKAWKIYWKITWVVFPYVLVQGLWTALYGRRTPLQIRDYVYLWICELQILTSGKVRKRKYWIAKWIGLAVWAWAFVVGFIVCPPLFIANIVLNELNLANFPQSETHRHIGQWGPWAATTLVLLAALISAFHFQFEEQVKSITNQAFYRLGHGVHGAGRRMGLRQDGEAGPAVEANVVGAKARPVVLGDVGRSTSQALYPRALRNTAWKLLGGFQDHIIKPATNLIISIAKRTIEEFDNTRTFWKDPQSTYLDGRQWHTDRHGDKIEWHELHEKHNHHCIIGDRYHRVALDPQEPSADGNGTTDFSEQDSSSVLRTSLSGGNHLNPRLLPGVKRILRPLENRGIIHHSAQDSDRPIPSVAQRAREINISVAQNDMDFSKPRVSAGALCLDVEGTTPILENTSLISVSGDSMATDAPLEEDSHR